MEKNWRLAANIEVARLATRRKLLQIPALTMAKRLRLDPAHFSRIESGEYRCPLDLYLHYKDELEKLARGLTNLEEREHVEKVRREKKLQEVKEELGGNDV